jgi:CheY-like chemotaxis protein
LLEIETWNHELQSRVQEKTEALHRAQTEIAQSEKLAALGYLAAGMAHEIRNPLNSISLFTQLLRQGADEVETGDYLGKILKEVDRIDGIIRRLVYAANRGRLVVDDVRLDQVLQDALEIFAPQIEARQIQVSFSCPEVPKQIKADRAELEQIFTNLLMNAVEELPPKGLLSIDIASPEGLIEVRVSDNGNGIAPENCEAIFKPFFSTKARGTGIGLPVARRIAQLYHGDVRIEQTSSAGTTFLVTIPREQKNIFRETMTANGPQILIIDDDPFFQRILSDVFRENGFRVFTASDGIEGVKLYQEIFPDVVISDLVMPRMGGVSTCMEISRVAGERQPIIILLTSMFQEGPHEHDVPEMGARFHIPKSTSPLDIVILVEQLIERSKAQASSL